MADPNSIVVCRSWPSRSWPLGVLVFGVLFASPAHHVQQATAVEPVIRIADSDAGEKAQPGNRQRAASESTDRTTEKRVLDMVRAHLPELQKLLDQLRENEPKQYNAAIANLAKSAKRLEIAQKRDPRLFELEVQIVKSLTSVNLLIAKLKVRDSEADRQALRKATVRLHDAETARAEFDLEQLRERLQRAQQQLSAAQDRFKTRQANKPSQIQRSFTSHLRRAGRKDNSAPSKKDKSP